MQHLIAAALNGEVDVVAEIGLVGDGVQDVLAHVLGIGCGEAHTHVGYGLSHTTKQFGKRADMQHLTALFLDDDAVVRPLAVGQQTVGVDVLTEQRHLLEAAVVQVAHLGENALDVA